MYPNTRGRRLHKNLISISFVMISISFVNIFLNENEGFKVKKPHEPVFCFCFFVYTRMSWSWGWSRVPPCWAALRSRPAGRRSTSWAQTSWRIRQRWRGKGPLFLSVWRMLTFSDLNVCNLFRLLAQLDETENAFEQFWSKHQLKLEQCLQLRHFEQDFREVGPNTRG